MKRYVRIIDQIGLTIDQVKQLPPSRELSIVVTKLQEAQMWTARTVAENREQDPPPPMNEAGARAAGLAWPIEVTGHKATIDHYGQQLDDDE
jgi:hypothetical protein